MDAPDRAAATADHARAWLGRPDSYLDAGRIERFLASGGWTADTFVSLLERHAAERPEALAIIDQDGTATTWGKLRERAEAFAAALEGRGYAAGDRLGVQLPNWSEFAVVVLGAARIGVVPVFMHTPYRGFELEYILGLTAARGLVVPATYRGYDHLALAADLRGKLPALREIIVVRAGHERAVVGAHDGIVLDDLLAEGQGRQPQAPPPASTDLFVVMFTSGTTGRPKGVMHLHANLLDACRKYVAAYDLGPDDRWLIVTPLTHLTAFGIAYLAGALAGGGSAVLLEAWDAGRALELAERHGVTHFVGAPPMLIDVARSADLDSRDLSALRFMMYAGAPCPIEILRTLHERLGCAMSVFYGWTEGLAHTYSLPSDPLEVTSVTIGRTGEGWEARVVGDDGRDVAVGETGEFWGRGPNLSPGYYHQADFMAARYGPDGWFMSGDLVTRNADGTFTFVARKDDVINRGGNKIDPRELEEILYRHPAIAQAVVVGYPDARLGERTCAFVVPAEGRTVDLEEVKAYLGAQGLARYKWPERLEILARLPMTPTGKIMRYELRAQLAAATHTAGRSAGGEETPVAAGRGGG